MWYDELYIASEGLKIPLFAAGGLTFHIWRMQMLQIFWELARRFRAVIVSVSTSEKTHASTNLFFFNYYFALNLLS